MPSLYTDKLISYIKELVQIVKYDNQYAWQLLQQVTAGREAIIQVDDVKLLLKAGDSNGYTLSVTEDPATGQCQFITTADTLRNMIDGYITVDHAVEHGTLYIFAPFEDLMNIYRLMTCLLAQGALNKRIRKLWNEFDRTMPTHRKTNLFSLEKQKPIHGRYIKGIPEKILMVRI